MGFKINLKQSAPAAQMYSSLPGDTTNGEPGYVYEPLKQWADANLAGTLWAQGDPAHAFGDAVDQWRAEQDAAREAFYSSGPHANVSGGVIGGYGEGISPASDANGVLLTGREFTPAPFDAWTVDQVRRYLDPAQYAGNPMANQKVLPYLPQVVMSPDGTPFVRYNQAQMPSAVDKGFLTGKLSPMIGPTLASAVAGLGFSSFLGPSAGLSSTLAEEAALTGSGMGAGASAGTSSWSLSGAIENALNPKNLVSSAIKSGVSQLASGGTISPTGLLTSVAGNAVGSTVSGAVNDATGSGLIGNLAGTVAGTATKAALTPSPTYSITGGSGGSGTTSTPSAPSNAVPMSFSMALAPYQPIYQRA